MIHKRELSDSRIESGSSLFYCVPHHQQNPDRAFRSAGIFLSGFLYRFFLNPFWVVSASGLILLKGQASADIRPPAHVALTITIVAYRDNRSVRFQAYRMPARRDCDDIPPAAHVALAFLIPARRDDCSVRFQACRVPRARRDCDDIPLAAHVAFAILILARRDDRSVRFQAYRVTAACRRQQRYPASRSRRIAPIAILCPSRRPFRPISSLPCDHSPPRQRRYPASRSRRIRLRYSCPSRRPFRPISSLPCNASPAATATISRQPLTLHFPA